MVPSGRDGKQAIVHSIDVGTVVDRPAVSMVVYDAHGDQLRVITHNLLVIEQGIFQAQGVVCAPSRTSVRRC